MTIQQLIYDARIASEKAKLLRDKGVSGGGGQYFEDAINVLQDYVARIKPQVDIARTKNEPSSETRDLVQAYVDSMGQIGGNYRRLAKHDLALQAFEEGHNFEMQKRFEVENTYCSVNFLSMQLESGARRVSELQPEVDRTIAMLLYQTKGRRKNDAWAYADLGQCLLLKGELPSAQKAYLRFKSLASGKPEWIDSARRVLKSLETGLRQSGDPIASDIAEGLKLLG